MYGEMYGHADYAITSIIYIKAFVLKDHQNPVKKVLLHNTVQIPTLRLTLTMITIAAGLMATGC